MKTRLFLLSVILLSSGTSFAQSIPSPTPPSPEIPPIPSFGTVTQSNLFSTRAFVAPDGSYWVFRDAVVDWEKYVGMSNQAINPRSVDWTLTVVRADAEGNVFWEQEHPTNLNFRPHRWLWTNDGGGYLIGAIMEDTSFAGREFQAPNYPSWGRASAGFLARAEVDGTWSWVTMLDEQNYNVFNEVHLTADDLLEVRGTYGTLRTRPNTIQALRFPDGSFHPLPYVTYRGQTFPIPNEFVALFDRQGHFVQGMVKEDPEAETKLTAAGEIPLDAYYERRGLLRFNGEGEFLAPTRDFFRKIYERRRPDFLPYWDPHYTDVRFIGELSNESRVLFGRGQQVPSEWVAAGSIAPRTFYLAMVDRLGRLQAAIIFDDMVRGEFALEGDNLVFIPWNADSEPLDLTYLLDDFSLSKQLNGSFTLVRKKGPFSGLTSHDGWRDSASFGWMYDHEAGWWWSHTLQSHLYVDSRASLSEFWFYDLQSNDWLYTHHAYFPWRYSAGQNEWRFE